MGEKLEKLKVNLFICRQNKEGEEKKNGAETIFEVVWLRIFQN